MKRSLIALAAALVLAATLVPLALAADDPVADPTSMPVVEPTQTPDPTATPFGGQGEVVIDPTFITSTPSPASTPAGEVKAATGHAKTTPPPTDTIAAPTASGTGLQVLLVLAVVGSVLALLVARVPAARRR